jgi:hypothetical protein
MADYQAFSIVLTGMGMIIALTYYALQIRNQNKTRQAQLFMELYATYRNPEFRKLWHRVLSREFKDYQEWQEKYMNPDDLADHTTVQAFLEGVGVLLKRGFIDIEMVDDLLSIVVRLYWEKYGSIVQGSREMLGEPKLMADTEYLYREIRKRYDQEQAEPKT